MTAQTTLVHAIQPALAAMAQRPTIVSTAWPTLASIAMVTANVRSTGPETPAHDTLENAGIRATSPTAVPAAKPRIASTVTITHTVMT